MWTIKYAPTISAAAKNAAYEVNRPNATSALLIVSIKLARLRMEYTGHCGPPYQPSLNHLVGPPLTRSPTLNVVSVTCA